VLQAPERTGRTPSAPSSPTNGITPGLFLSGPSALTLLPTYRCTAACEQCCFGSSPSVEGRLSLIEMKDAVDKATAAFPTLKLFCVSGGECFLLGEDLFSILRYAAEKTLLTRVVTNGFWAKSKTAAKRTVEKAHASGLCEMNLSTGRDHAQFVPISSIINAAEAAVKAGITTFITVEEDAPDSALIREIMGDPTLAALKRDSPGRLVLSVNTWMKFNDSHQPRRRSIDEPLAFGGCTSVLETLVVTPYRDLKACCGLTAEYIPEMRAGSLDDPDWKPLFDRQATDFIKIWIAVDGPQEIIKKIMPEALQEQTECVHNCQACALLFRDDRLRQRLRQEYPKHVSDVLLRYSLKQELARKGVVID
jgi:hypothetical protein